MWGENDPDAPDPWIRAIARVESGGNPAAVSPKGAFGLMQVMPATARQPGFGLAPLSPEQTADPDAMRQFGEQYWQKMLEKYDGDVQKALAAYNAGPGRTDKAIEQHGDDFLSGLPEETRNYVPKVMRTAQAGQGAPPPAVSWGLEDPDAPSAVSSFPPDGSRTPDGSLVVHSGAPTGAQPAAVPAFFDLPNRIPRDHARKWVNKRLTDGMDSQDIASLVINDINKLNGTQYTLDELLQQGFSPSQIIAFGTGLRDVSKGRAVAEGAVRGVAETLPVITGAVTGAKIGGTLGTAVAPGPGTLIGGVLGTAFGGGAGLLFGNAAARGVPETQDYVPADRPWQAGGYDFGQGASGAVLPFGLAKYPATKIGRMVTQVGEDAQKAPLSFLAREAYIAAGGGAGGAAAEALAPDNSFARIVGNLTGGVQGMLGGSLLRTVWGYFKSAIGAASEGGRTATAGRLIVRSLERAGEDPEVIQQRLAEFTRTALLSEGLEPPTPAQITGSPTLAKLENSLARMSEAFGEDRAKRARQAVEVSRSLVNQMFNLAGETADPVARKAVLQQASAAAGAHFEALLSARLSGVLSTARLAARRAIPELGTVPDDQLSAASRRRLEGISRAADAQVAQALEEAKAIRTELYSRVPVVPAQAQATLAGAREILGRGLLVPDQQRFNVAAIDQGLAALSEAGGATTSQQLLELRKIVGAEISARNIPGGNDYEAGRFRALYSAISRDLDNLDLPELRIADTFNARFKETFTGALMGDADSLKRRGLEWVDPELLLRTGQTGSVEQRDIQFRQLREMAGFPREQMSDPDVVQQAARFLPDVGGPQPAAAMQRAQETYLRALAADAVDPATGVVDPNRVRSFINDNAATLSNFPGLETQLRDAARATQLVEQTRAQMTAARDRLLDPKVAAFARVSQFFDPTEAIDDTIKRARDPGLGLRRLFDGAKKAGPEAVEGAQVALLDWATRKAGDSDTFMQGLNKALMGPFRGLAGQGSPLATAVQQGVVPAGTARRFQQITHLLANVEKSMAETGQLSLTQAAGPSGFIEDFFLRITGAGLAQNLANIAPGGASAHGLIVGGAGSRALRQLSSYYQKWSLPEVMLALAKDPEAFRMAIEKTTNNQRRLQIKTALDAYISAQLPHVLREDEREYP